MAHDDAPMEAGNPVMRFFDTAGPVKPAGPYCIPPLGRFDLDEVLRPADGEKYFVLHAPRRAGETSTLPAPRDLRDVRSYRVRSTRTPFNLLGPSRTRHRIGDLPWHKSSTILSSSTSSP